VYSIYFIFAILYISAYIGQQQGSGDCIEITEWKAVQARVSNRATSCRRARASAGSLKSFVSEGDLVTAGQTLGLVIDDKIGFQIDALDAQLAALAAQLETAQAEFARGETLLNQGVVTRQRLTQLSTDVEVTRNQIVSTEAQRAVLTQQQSEGTIVAPADGRVLTVPASRGAVIMPGEPVATIGSGGFYLRLAVPERFAGQLQTGASIRIATCGAETEGRLAKIYPQIENGRVIADVEVDKLDTAFVNARILVDVPIGTRGRLCWHPGRPSSPAMGWISSALKTMKALGSSAPSSWAQLSPASMRA
jgi:RND family efflux transporter MFP subunit